MIRITIELARPLVPQLAAAVEAIRRGEVVAFPTDTLYGLAVDPRSDAALDALFALKGRSADRTVALIAASLAQAGEVADISRRAATPRGSVLAGAADAGRAGERALAPLVASAVRPGRDPRARPSRRTGAGRGVWACD